MTTDEFPQWSLASHPNDLIGEATQYYLAQPGPSQDSGLLKMPLGCKKRAIYRTASLEERPPAWSCTGLSDPLSTVRKKANSQTTARGRLSHCGLTAATPVRKSMARGSNFP